MHFHNCLLRIIVFAVLIFHNFAIFYLFLFLFRHGDGDDDAFRPQADGQRQQQPGPAAAGPVAGPAAGPAAEPCCICMASPKDTILLPCGHVCVCSTCAALLEAQGIDGEPEGVYLCPVCRTRVTSRHRLFYA